MTRSEYAIARGVAQLREEQKTRELTENELHWLERVKPLIQTLATRERVHDALARK